MLVSLVITFCIYALVLFVVSFIVVDYGQNYLYNESTPGIPVKVAVGSLILAGMLTWTRTGFATMFTSDIAFTVLLAIVWSGVFILIYRFQPWHGFGLAMATLLIFAGMATLVVDSLTASKPAGRITNVDEPAQRIRRPSGGAIVPVSPVETKK